MLTHHFTTTHSPSTLTALIAKHRPDWQVCFLNNNHRPVIGICPKTAWQIEFDGTFIAHRFDRHTGQTTAYATTYSDWQNELIAYGKNLDCPSQKDEYAHGLMGFIGYDVSANHLNTNIGIKKNQPCAYLGHYDVYLKKNDTGFELFGIDVDKEFFNTIKNEVAILLKEKLTLPTPTHFTSTWQKQDYTQAFNQTQEYIKAGDTYQINLTQSWQADLANLSSHLPNLQHQMNAPFAGYLKLNQDYPFALSLSKGEGQKTDMVRQAHHERFFELLSVSPELFFEFYGENDNIHLITKPIKGTRPRHDNPTIDNDLKNELKNSEKDISENLMIVDLLRNDLGKYAKIGTVKTPKRFAIESFKNVHHMVSTITAELNNSHSLSVLFGSLPAGSITGTPKKRACEIIHELEISPRGAYCGTMGYLNFDGTGIWNVLIRTLQKTDKVELWAGGGVTIKSDMNSEYQECMDKVEGIMGVIERG